MKKITIRKTNQNTKNIIMFPDGSIQHLNNVSVDKLKKCCWFLRHHKSYNFGGQFNLSHESFELEQRDTKYLCYLENPKLNTCKLCFCKT